MAFDGSEPRGWRGVLECSIVDVRGRELLPRQPVSGPSVTFDVRRSVQAPYSLRAWFQNGWVEDSPCGSGSLDIGDTLVLHLNVG